MKKATLVANDGNILEEIDYYRSHFFQPELLEGAQSLGYTTLSRSRRAETGCAVFHPIEKKIIVKKFFSPPTSSDSVLRTLEGDPVALYSHEKRNVNRIVHNVNPDLVANLVGNDDGGLALFYEYLEAPSDREAFLEARRDKDLQGQLNLIYAGAKRIATFDGLIHQYKDSVFQLDLQGKRYTQGVQLARLTDYLLRILVYKHQHELKETLPKDEEGLKAWVRRKIDPRFREKVQNLVTLGGAFNHEQVLQHGDCRVQHVLGGKFVDLERFGPHNRGYDLATYVNAEGGISQPSVTEIPNLLAYFLAYEYAHRRNDSSRVQELDKLDNLDRNKFSERVSAGVLLQFLAQFLKMDIEENLHLDATNKHYSPAQLEQVIEGIPRYSRREMFTRRLDHINDVLELLVERQVFDILKWHKIENVPGMKEYCSRLGEYLLRWGLVDVKEETLRKLK